MGNETSPGSGLGATGGGASASIAKPDWQTGPGVPADGARDVPDLALSSAGHDAYLITYQENNLFRSRWNFRRNADDIGGSALLNQYLVKQGLQKAAGLGNINPQLYRLAQSVPAAFHDIVSGNNNVPCLQGSPGCTTGSYGYAAGPGYDQATGIGSVDANMLVTSWKDDSEPGFGDADVELPRGYGQRHRYDARHCCPGGTKRREAESGTVSFVALEQALGSGKHNDERRQPADGFGDDSRVAAGCGNVRRVGAQYAGNAAFSAGGASVKIQATLPTTAGVAAVSAQVPGPVFAFQTGTQPMTWQAGMTLQELAGVPAMLTGFTVDDH